MICAILKNNETTLKEGERFEEITAFILDPNHPCRRADGVFRLARVGRNL